MALSRFGSEPDVTPEEAQHRWRRVEELFNAAAELDPRDRTAFLRALCDGDESLRTEVESLLRAAEHTLGMLRQPVDSAARSAGGADLINRRIGNFEIIKGIGAGGMGEVYHGARADDQFRQRVAIKLIRFGLDQNPAMIPRFLAERQILANLDHPNIARLLDGGLTPEGWPYLVMELVEGVPIEVYCQRGKLSTRDRLKLFQKVCEALEYTHQNLIVHRDIKPSNILVTRKGVPKLLDFGIAHLLDVDDNAEASRLMTPSYASPEQILGNAITTATDVFGLGVLLYELLAGGHPFGNADEDIAVAICRAIPAPLTRTAHANSERAAPDARRWTPELDAILLKSLAKDPAARYRSVAQFSDDLSAYVDGRPVGAYAHSWRYVSWRFIGRHRAVAVLTLLAICGLIALSIFMGILLRRATSERLKAEVEAKFLGGMFNAATPAAARGETVSARTLLDDANRRIDSEFPNMPDVRGTLLGSIAEAYKDLGVYDEALKAARRGYELKKATLGARNSTTLDALFQYATLIRLQGDYAVAEPLFRDAVSGRRATAGPNSAEYADSLSGLGECLYLESKDVEAESILREALTVNRRDGPNFGSGTRNYLALLLERKGEYREAATLLEEALAISLRTEGANNAEYANSLHNLASAKIDLGDLADAEVKLREALAIRRKVLGNHHPDLGYSLNNLGYVLLEEGKWPAAEPYFHEAMTLARAQLGDQNPRMAGHLNNSARLLQAKGDRAGAAEVYQQALDILRRTNTLTSWPASQILLNLGGLEFDNGHYERAESLARQSLEMRRKLSSASSPGVAAALIDLAEDQLFQGDVHSAIPLLHQALEIREAKLWPTHPAVIGAKVRLGESLLVDGQIDAAAGLLKSAVASANSAPFPLLGWQLAEADSALAACLAAQGRAAEADALSRKSRGMLATHPRPAFRQPAATRVGEWKRASHSG